MCKCTPEIRTPFCGKPGCTWPPQTTPLAPTLEQDVTAWQAIEKARFTLDTLLELHGLDDVGEQAIIEALRNLVIAKHRINTRRTQRIEASAKAGK